MNRGSTRRGGFVLEQTELADSLLFVAMLTDRWIRCIGSLLQSTAVIAAEITATTASAEATTTATETAARRAAKKCAAKFLTLGHFAHRALII